MAIKITVLLKYRFIESQRRHLITVGFLEMLEINFGFQKSFRLAVEGFTNYMVEYYNLILSGTDPYFQERFDKFKKHYVKLSARSTYMRIIKSTKKILKARFKRCPFSEVMKHYGFEDFSYAFCLSGPAFSKTALPAIKFKRVSLISGGDKYRDNTWIFNQLK